MKIIEPSPFNSGIGLTPAQDVVNAAQYGSSAQTLRTLAELQQGQIRLS